MSSSVSAAQRLAGLLRERGVEKVSNSDFGTFFEIDGRCFAAYDREGALSLVGNVTPEEVVRGLLGPEGTDDGGDVDA